MIEMFQWPKCLSRNDWNVFLLNRLCLSIQFIQTMGVRRGAKWVFAPGNWDKEQKIIEHLKLAVKFRWIRLVVPKTVCLPVWHCTRTRCHDRTERRTKPFTRLYSTKNTSMHQHLQRKTTTAWYETNHDLIPTCNTNDQAKQCNSTRPVISKWSTQCRQSRASKPSHQVHCSVVMQWWDCSSLISAPFPAEADCETCWGSVFQPFCCSGTFRKCLRC